MNRATFLNKEIIFGTYFIGQWIEASGCDEVSEAFMVLSKNPFKFIPLFITTAINSTAELTGMDKVKLFDVLEEIDRLGGVTSPPIEQLLKVFTDSVSANAGKGKVVTKTTTKK